MAFLRPADFDLPPPQQCHFCPTRNGGRKWDKVFKNGSSKIFKGCLPQILLGPFLNNLWLITLSGGKSKSRGLKW